MPIEVKLRDRFAVTLRHEDHSFGPVPATRGDGQPSSIEQPIHLTLAFEQRATNEGYRILRIYERP